MSTPQEILPIGQKVHVTRRTGRFPGQIHAAPIETKTGLFYPVNIGVRGVEDVKNFRPALIKKRK